MPNDQPRDSGHWRLDYRVPEIDHGYGDNVHVLSDPHIRTLLARLCDRRTVQPQVNHLIHEIYRGMLAIAIGAEFPRERVTLETRMIEHTPAGVFAGEVVSSRTPAVTVAIARAGILPSHICYEQLLHFLEPRRVRQDYLHMGRKLGSDGRVLGADLNAAKIGGDVEGAMVIIPDPMAATGSSICRAIQHYKKTVEGKPLAFLAVHLIATPEHLRRVHDEHPEAVVYAARIDRGLSSPEVLADMPGRQWDLERGLNNKGYIVPGAGGLGEILNNAFV